MEKIIKILMDRDGIDRQEAIDLCNEAKEAILEYPEDADDLMMDILDLEPDYLEDLLF